MFWSDQVIKIIEFLGIKGIKEYHRIEDEYGKMIILLYTDDIPYNLRKRAKRLILKVSNAKAAFIKLPQTEQEEIALDFILFNLKSNGTLDFDNIEVNLADLAELYYDDSAMTFQIAEEVYEGLNLLPLYRISRELGIKKEDIEKLKEHIQMYV